MRDLQLLRTELVYFMFEEFIMVMSLQAFLNQPEIGAGIETNETVRILRALQ